MRANVRMLIRPHHTPNKFDSHQICSVEGRRDEINKLVHFNAIEAKAISKIIAPMSL